MQLSQIPGYDRASRRAGRLEDSWRAFPFLGITERICGVEVNLLTLRMFIQLCASRSPFFIGGRIRPEDIAVILWRLSPQYETPKVSPQRSQRTQRKKKEKVPLRDLGTSRPGGRAVKNRRAFIKSILALPYGKTRRGINRFIDRMLIDKPPSTGGNPASEAGQADVSYAAYFIHELANAYGWSQDYILDLPMPALFQYVRQINRDQLAGYGKTLPRFNPLRSRLTKRILDKAIKNSPPGAPAPQVPEHAEVRKSRNKKNQKNLCALVPPRRRDSAGRRGRLKKQ